MNVRLVVFLCVGAVLFWGLAAWAAPNPHLVKGKKLLNDMEEAKALESFKQALEEPGLPVKEKAQIYLHMGIAHFNLQKKNEAKKDFRQALEIFPDIKLPAMTSPKIRAVFKEVQAKYKADNQPKVVIKPPPPKPPKPPIVPKPKPSDGRAPLRWSAWGCLAVALGAVGTGVAMAMLAKDYEEKANDVNIPWKSNTGPSAEDYHDKAETRALIANIMWGVAGGAAVASGVLFYFGYRKKSTASASVVPIPGGVMVQVGGIRW